MGKQRCNTGTSEEGWDGVGVMWNVNTVGRNRKNEGKRYQMSTPPHMTHCFWRIQSAVCIYAPRAVWIRGINKPHNGAVNQSMPEYCLIGVSRSEEDELRMSLQLTGDEPKFMWMKQYWTDSPLSIRRIR